MRDVCEPGRAKVSELFSYLTYRHTTKLILFTTFSLVVYNYPPKGR